jgi:hypothetical protein
VATSAICDRCRRRRRYQEDRVPMMTTIDDRIQGFAVTVQTRGEWPVAGPIWSAVGHCNRYLGFVRVVVERYEAANESYIGHAERIKAALMAESTGSRRLTEDETDALLAKWTLAESLQLEIESFYLFAKILLDRVADVVCLYFDNPRPSKGSSHSFLVNRAFDRICRTRSIDGRALVPSLEDLDRRVVQHRNDVVEHLADPRWSPGMGWGADRRVKVSMGLVAPKADEPDYDTRTTEDPAALLKEIEAYIVAVFDFLETNIEKSVLTPSSSTSPTAS